MLLTGYPNNLELFYPFKKEFLDRAFGGNLAPELRIQYYCEIARQISRAIDVLPFNKDCDVPTEKILGSNTRIFSHLILVDYLEQQGLDKNEDAINYINRVHTAADKCYKILTDQLQARKPLTEIYTKNPVREEIDVKKGGFSKSVVLESTQEMREVVERIFSKPLKLVCYKEREVYAYLPEEAVRLITDTQNALYQSLRSYVQDPEKNVILYPHESPDGKIYGCLFEQREFITLLEELTAKAISKYIESKQLDNEKIILFARSEEAKKIEIQTEKQLSLDITNVVNENKFIQMKSMDTELAYVQDIYLLKAIVKQVVEKTPIEKIRNLIHQKAKQDSTATAPEIRFPRVTYFAVLREGKYVNVKYAADLLEGKNERLKHLIDIFNIGIRRFIRSYQEQNTQKQENQKLEDLANRFKIPNLQNS